MAENLPSDLCDLDLWGGSGRGSELMVARWRLLLVTLVARSASLELSLCTYLSISFHSSRLMSFTFNQTALHVVSQRVVLFMIRWRNLHALSNCRCRLGISCCCTGHSCVLLHCGGLGRGPLAHAQLLVALPSTSTCRWRCGTWLIICNFSGRYSRGLPTSWHLRLRGVLIRCRVCFDERLFAARINCVEGLSLFIKSTVY